MIKTTAQSIVLGGRIPSKKNSKQIIRRGNRSMLVSSRAHSIWHTDAMWQLKEQRTRPMEGKIGIEMMFYFPDKRRADLTNKAESIMDLLVDAGIIEDDNANVCPEVLLRFGGVDRERPRVEVSLVAL
ncbi:MAG: RusA family crossover junction endodeoxyribonuclease [Negativicutes bacterium]|nr:RusA family crossover junction endodeoxyribonuclease [Negativicutes bacterium]